MEVHADGPRLPEDSAAPLGILILPPLYDRQELLLDPVSVTFCFSFQSKCQQSGILPHPSSDIFRTNKQLTYLAEINHLKKPQFGSFFCSCFSYYPQVQLASWNQHLNWKGPGSKNISAITLPVFQAPPLMPESDIL